MKLKPFRDYNEHEVRNLYALDTGEGTAGQLVKIKGNGFVNGASHGIALNINPTVKNAFFPRMAVKAQITLAQPSDTGKPLGFMLYDTTEKGFDKPLIYDEQRRQEKQAVVSGEAVPVVRKGMWLVGPWPSGVNPGPGSGCVAGNSGEWDLVVLSNTSGTARGRVFGEFLGTKDTDGYALVDINCFV